MKDQFVYTLRTQFPFINNQKILLGLSGGADSVFLLYFLNKFKYLFDFKIFAVHVNHNLRGKESDADEKFVQKLCFELGVKLFSQKVSITKKFGIEEFSRKLRYKIFEKIAENNAINYILTAHTASDDVETILMNILRGCGIQGLSGIEGKRPLRQGSDILLLRPILNFHKNEILNYLKKHKILFRSDSSNLSNNFTRNKIRNEILPQLETINLKTKKHILNLKKIANDESKALNLLLEDKINDILIEDKLGEIVVDFSRYMRYNANIRKVILSNLLKGKANFVHITSVYDKITTSTNGRYSLDLKNGFVIKKEKKRLIITHK